MKKFRRGAARHSSGGGGAVKLSLKRGDIASAETPLPTLLERGQYALARELVDGVRAQVEEARDLLAVQENIVFFCHRRIPATAQPSKLLG
jgi:hypothetical protein